MAYQQPELDELRKKPSAKEPAGREVFARYITRNGKRIYPKRAKVFHFYVKN